jgi:hypothetical protein
MAFLFLFNVGRDQLGTDSNVIPFSGTAPATVFGKSLAANAMAGS